MEKTNKLTGKDLINVGIYSALTLALFFVFGLLTTLPVIYPLLLFVWPFVCGIPMMLYYTKIKKFGMLTITGIICGAFSNRIYLDCCDFLDNGWPCRRFNSSNWELSEL